MRCTNPQFTLLYFTLLMKPPLTIVRTLRDGALLLFVCSCVRLSPVKFMKSFATWQHLAASGTYRIDADTLV